MTRAPLRSQLIDGRESRLDAVGIPNDAILLRDVEVNANVNAFAFELFFDRSLTVSIVFYLLLAMIARLKTLPYRYGNHYRLNEKPPFLLRAGVKEKPLRERGAPLIIEQAYASLEGTE
jgi:hypothetical protein